MNESMHTDRVEFDTAILEKGLVERNLKGMSPVIKLIQELYAIDTYEALIPVLQQRNQFGHFELSTKDVSTYHRIMGNSHPDLHSAECHLVVDADVIRETVAALQEIRRQITDETRRRLTEILSAKNGPANEKPQILAA